MCTFLTGTTQLLDMHIDARHLDNGTLIEGDICIVGAGAAGISMALDLKDSKKKIILLEGGGFEYENEVQDLYDGENLGQRYYPLRSCRLHYFGGTTGHWAGMCSPYDPIDFKKRAWVPNSGWPITRDELDPFYAKANNILELGPYRYDEAYWNEQIPRTPLPLNGEVVWNKMWQFSAPTRFGTRYRDDIVNAPNIHLYTYCNLTNIEADPGVNRVLQLQVKNHAGKIHRVKAKQFVLACGAIQNARMLLASNKQQKAGLGNEYDQVGRYFMEHLEVRSANLYLEKQHPMDLYIFADIGGTPRAEISFTEKAQEENEILNGTISFTPIEFAKNQKPMIDVWTNKDPRKSFDNLLVNFDDMINQDESFDVNQSRVFELFTRMEQAPNPDSRVLLSDEMDSLGVPKANLHWDLTELDQVSLRKIYQVFGREVGKAGVGRVKLFEFLWDANKDDMLSTLGGGWHHMGTTRMHEDPKKGVVDKNCKVHGLSNLYVAGSACCSTSGAPNPTLNLVALSLRLSDHLKNLA